MFRYFMVSYQAFHSYGLLAIGTHFFSSDDGEIPSKTYMIEELEKDPEIRSRPVIFNIFEFKNRKDYLDFTGF